jgi:hypothetical protein
VDFFYARKPLELKVFAVLAHKATPAAEYFHSGFSAFYGFFGILSRSNR